MDMRSTTSPQSARSCPYAYGNTTIPPACSACSAPEQVDATLSHGAAPRLHHRRGCLDRPWSTTSHDAMRRTARIGPQRHLLLPPPGETPKRLLDIVGALTLALLLSPLLLVVGLMLVRDHGPIIYSHSRTGRHGKTFGCLKFRTMVPNADPGIARPAASGSGAAIGVDARSQTAQRSSRHDHRSLPAPYQPR